MKSRTFATEEAKSNADQAAELTENEKKLTEEEEKSSKDVESLNDKTKDLDVSFLIEVVVTRTNVFLVFRTNTNDP